MRRFSAVLVAVLAATLLAGLAPPATAAAVTYVQPVDGQVVDGFRPPKTQYGSGNRGLTYATADRSEVRASAPGRVTFAGQVGGALHVVVQHADGVRTTYAFLRAISTRVGANVVQGARVGTSATSFHFGARIGDAYVDPAILLASGPARVHLVPDGEFSEEGASDDRFSLTRVVLDALSVPAGAVTWLRDASGEVVDFGAAATRASLERLVTVLDDIVNLGEMAGSFATMAAALADILEAFLGDCTDAALPPPRVTQRRIAVFVAGLGSSWQGKNGPSAKNNLSRRFRAVEELGYAEADVYDFSYRGGRTPKPYQAADTVHGLDRAAGDLRDFLDQLGRDNPGVAVDLIAHSQGGLVAREALSHRYDSPTRVLPPVAHYVSVATPHHGTDAATTFAWLRWTAAGRRVREIAGEVHEQFDLTAPGVAQLSETSKFVRRINDEELRGGVSYTSIASATDIIVPGVRARLRGAGNVLVDAGPLHEAHSGITTNDSARHELALALNDQPPTCQSVADTARRAATSAAVATAEDAPGFVRRGY